MRIQPLVSLLAAALAISLSGLSISACSDDNPQKVADAAVDIDAKVSTVDAGARDGGLDAGTADGGIADAGH